MKFTHLHFLLASIYYSYISDKEFHCMRTLSAKKNCSSHDDTNEMLATRIVQTDSLFILP